VDEQLRHFEMDLEPRRRKIKIYDPVSNAEFIAAQIIPIIIGVILYILLPEKTLDSIASVALLAATVWFVINLGLALQELLPP